MENHNGDIIVSCIFNNRDRACSIYEFDCNNAFGLVECNKFPIDWVRFIIYRKYIRVIEDKDE